MTTTPRIGAPVLEEGQAIPETTVNEQARFLEQGAGFFIVIDKTLTAPPGSPAEGDAHIVAATATGAWTGKEKNIAFYMGGAWSFVTPIEGTHADCQADDTTYRYSGSAWAAVTASGALLIANNLSDLGSASTARTNLGLGTAAVAASSSFLQVSSNLSDLASAATARTNLGATTVGGNLITLANPGAITFIRVNADNSVSALSASAFRTAIGAGTGTGSGDLVSTNNLSDVANAATAAHNLGLGTADSPQLTGLNIGHATDTTVTRASAGDIAVEGNIIYRAGGTDVPVTDGGTGSSTAAGARTNLDAACRTPQIQSVSSSATVTPTFADDQVIITAQAAGLTLANPTGTALDGWGLVIRIKDNGTARSISYGTQYRAVGVTLPTTTVISKTLYLGMIFNNADTKWDVVAVAQEA